MELDAGKHIAKHACRPQPTVIQRTSIVAAYGARMCPSLVERLGDEELEVKTNTFRALIAELAAPQQVYGCIKAGILPILADMLNNQELVVRQRAAECLAIIAADATGRVSIAEENIIPAIKSVSLEEDFVVRQHCYTALLRLSSVITGAHSVVEAGCVPIIVERIATGDSRLRPTLLQLVYNCASRPRGLEDALQAGAVKVCVDLIKSNDTAKCDAARTLRVMCFHEQAKQQALELNALAFLVPLLSDSDSAVRSHVSGALVGITTTDEGKKEMFPLGGAMRAVALLLDVDEAVQLNGLKLIANLAAYPAIRDMLCYNNECLSTLDRMEKSPRSELFAKHARIAKEAVLWKP